MSINGTPWHIEKGEGYNDKYRKCYNCKYFDDNCCNKKNIPISINHAVNCSSYENSVVYLKEEKEEKKEKKKKKNLIEYHEENKTIKSVQIKSAVKYNDAVKILDYTSNYNIYLNLRHRTKKEYGVNLINYFIDVIQGKEKNQEFNFCGNKYKIIDVYKNGLNYSNMKLIKDENIELINKNYNKNLKRNS